MIASFRATPDEQVARRFLRFLADVKWEWSSEAIRGKPTAGVGATKFRHPTGRLVMGAPLDLARGGGSETRSAENKPNVGNSR